MDNELGYFPFGLGAHGAYGIIVPVFKVYKCMWSPNPANRPFIKCLFHAEVALPGYFSGGPLVS